MEQRKRSSDTLMDEKAKVKKKKHRVADAKWRAGISECFDILKNVVVNKSDSKRYGCTKLSVLQDTKQYIKTLEEYIQHISKNTGSPLSSDKFSEFDEHYQIKTVEKDLFRYQDSQSFDMSINDATNTSDHCDAKVGPSTPSQKKIATCPSMKCKNKYHLAEEYSTPSNSQHEDEYFGKEKRTKKYNCKRRLESCYPDSREHKDQSTMLRENDYDNWIFVYNDNSITDSIEMNSPDYGRPKLTETVLDNGNQNSLDDMTVPNVSYEVNEHMDNQAVPCLRYNNTAENSPHLSFNNLLESPKNKGNPTLASAHAMNFSPPAFATEARKNSLIIEPNGTHQNFSNNLFADDETNSLFSELFFS